MFARHGVDEAVVYEKGRELVHNLRKKGCTIDLFLDTQTYGSLDEWTIVIESAIRT